MTEGSGFTDFCKNQIRKSEIGCKRCIECDKKGAFLSFRNKKISAYFCHSGLIDFAAPIVADGQIVGAFALNRDSFSDELKARIDELITNGTYSDANGNHVQMTSNELVMLLNDVQLFIQSQQQQQQTSQPTTAFDVSDAFATLSSKYGASYPADELQDKINEISMKYDSINNADLKRIVLEALTNGAYVAHGAVIDVTPTELDALVTAIDNDLGISGPTPQP